VVKFVVGGSPNQDFLHKVESVLPKLDSRNVFYLFQTCRRVSVKDQFWESLCVRAQTCSFNPIQLVGVLNAMTHRCGKRPRPRDVQLARHLLVQVKAQADDLSCQGITNTLNAMAKLGIFDRKQDEELLTVMGEAAKKRVAEFNSRDIASTLNALANFEVYDDKRVELLWGSQREGCRVQLAGDCEHFECTREIRSA